MRWCGMWVWSSQTYKLVNFSYGCVYFFFKYVCLFYFINKMFSSVRYNILLSSFVCVSSFSCKFNLNCVNFEVSVVGQGLNIDNNSLTLVNILIAEALWPVWICFFSNKSFRHVYISKFQLNVLFSDCCECQLDNKCFIKCLCQIPIVAHQPLKGIMHTDNWSQ